MKWILAILLLVSSTGHAQSIYSNRGVIDSTSSSSGGTGNVSGTGVTNQLSYWTSTSAISSVSGTVYDGVSLTVNMPVRIPNNLSVTTINGVVPGTSGTVSLTSTYVGYGSAGNTLMGDPSLTYANGLLTSAGGVSGSAQFTGNVGMGKAPSATAGVALETSGTISITGSTNTTGITGIGQAIFRDRNGSGIWTLGEGSTLGSFGFAIGTGNALTLYQESTAVTRVGVNMSNSLSPTATLQVSGTTLLTGGVSMTGLATGTATNNLCLTATGQVVSTTTLSGCLGVSDPALKKNIRPLPYGLAEIMAVDPVFYQDIRPGGFKGDQIGFLAYSVDRDGQRYRGLEIVMPELVDQNATYYEGKYYKGVVYERAIAVAFKGIQEQQKQIEALKLGIQPKATFMDRLKWLLTGK